MSDLDTQVDDFSILEIGRFYSRCLACGHGASLDEDHHYTRLDYGEHNGRGCGRKYAYWTSGYVGIFKEISYNGIPFISYEGAVKLMKEKNSNVNRPQV